MFGLSAGVSDGIPGVVSVVSAFFIACNVGRAMANQANVVSSIYERFSLKPDRHQNTSLELQLYVTDR